jgi:hypothetical protein
MQKCGHLDCVTASLRPKYKGFYYFWPMNELMLSFIYDFPGESDFPGKARYMAAPSVRQIALIKGNSFYEFYAKN